MPALTAAQLKKQVADLCKQASVEEIVSALVAQRKVFKMPKTLGAVCDAIAVVKAERSVINKLGESMSDEEKQMRERLMAELPTVEGMAAMGDEYQAEYFKERIPQVKDKEKFIAWAFKSKRLDLLPSSCNAAGISELWAEKKVIPGIEGFNAEKLSITKRKKTAGKK
jgi:hypothetical protein